MVPRWIREKAAGVRKPGAEHSEKIFSAWDYPLNFRSGIRRRYLFFNYSISDELQLEFIWSPVPCVPVGVYSGSVDRMVYHRDVSLP